MTTIICSLAVRRTDATVRQEFMSPSTTAVLRLLILRLPATAIIYLGVVQLLQAETTAILIPMQLDATVLQQLMSRLITARLQRIARLHVTAMLCLGVVQLQQAVI